MNRIVMAAYEHQFLMKMINDRVSRPWTIEVNL